MWTMCKYYFKYLYMMQTRYNRATREKIGFESVANVRETNIVSEDSIRNMLKELSNTSKVDQEHI